MTKKQGETLSSAAYMTFVLASLVVPLLQPGKRQRVRVLRTAETLGMSTLLDQALKHLTDERRPDSLQDNSFPSSHTMNTMAVATVAQAFARKQAPLWYGGVTLIGLSRLLLRRHRLRDVLGGACFGYCVARLELSRRRGWVLPRLAKRLTDAKSRFLTLPYGARH